MELDVPASGILEERQAERDETTLALVRQAAAYNISFEMLREHFPAMSGAMQLNPVITLALTLFLSAFNAINPQSTALSDPFQPAFSLGRGLVFFICRGGAFPRSGQNSAYCA